LKACMAAKPGRWSAFAKPERDYPRSDTQENHEE
jgi:hypothetical protein